MKNAKRIAAFLIIPVIIVVLFSCKGLFGDDPPPNPYAGMAKFTFDSDGGLIDQLASPVLETCASRAGNGEAPT